MISFENFFGRRADFNFCVSHSMKKDLELSVGITASVTSRIQIATFFISVYYYVDPSPCSTIDPSRAFGQLDQKKRNRFAEQKEGTFEDHSSRLNSLSRVCLLISQLFGRLDAKLRPLTSCRKSSIFQKHRECQPFLFSRSIRLIPDYRLPAKEWFNRHSDSSHSPAVVISRLIPMDRIFTVDSFKKSLVTFSNDLVACVCLQYELDRRRGLWDTSGGDSKV